jgi:hypothetical protein
LAPEPVQEPAPFAALTPNPVLVLTPAREPAVPGLLGGQEFPGGTSAAALPVQPG